MGEVARVTTSPAQTFNGPVEIGLRSLCLLVATYPAACSLQRLVMLDYLAVHSDDMPGGPPGLHPQTPHRSGELLVRREALQQGLLLYQSRRLLEKQYSPDGVFFCATERSAGFLDALNAQYVAGLRDRATWAAASFHAMTDSDLNSMTNAHLGEWGAEFARESVLWSEGNE